MKLIICIFSPKVLLQAIKSTHHLNPANYISTSLGLAGLRLKKIPTKHKQCELLVKLSYLVAADAHHFEHVFCLSCCSAVILGPGKLGLEPVLSGEEAVTGQHRDQPHDL